MTSLHHVLVAGLPLHGLRFALHVHQDHGASSIGHHRGHAGIAAERGNVVDDARAGFEGRGGNLGSVSVYGDQRFGSRGEYPFDTGTTRPTSSSCGDRV